MAEDDTQVISLGDFASAVRARARRVPYLVWARTDTDSPGWRLDGVLCLGRDPECEVVLSIPGVSRRHAEIRATDQALVLEDLASRNGTYVNGQRVERAELRDGDEITIGSAFLRVVFRDADDEEVIRRLQERSLRDALTGLHNRRSFDERLAAELAHARRHGSALSLVLLDLDRFKSINDTHGHPAGDAVLKELAARFSRQLRAEDTLARYGGEELALIARTTTASGAAIAAERLRGAARGAPMVWASASLVVTVSAGVAEIAGPTDTAEALIARADAALYDAKHQGRDRVVVAMPPS